jgi:hypothetical protein
VKEVGEHMAINYLKTAENMYKSSKTVFNAGEQWNISCYLAGYVVESYFNCILKIINPSHSSKSHLNENGINKSQNDPAQLVDKGYKMLLVTNPKIARYIKPNGNEYPKNIVYGDPKNNISKWNNINRYDQAIWKKKDAQVYQSEIDKINLQINDLKSKGLMKY